jgi:beta-alanine degradation protein BauB
VKLDPVITNPDLYRVVMENDRVRVLEYRDRPGERTTPHGHPDSVMVTLSSFRRRLVGGGREVDVELATGVTRWLAAQEHSGENIGDTATHVIFVELKEPRTDDDAGPSEAELGPARL